MVNRVNQTIATHEGKASEMPAKRVLEQSGEHNKTSQTTKKKEKKKENRKKKKRKQKKEKRKQTTGVLKNVIDTTRKRKGCKKNIYAEEEQIPVGTDKTTRS